VEYEPWQVVTGILTNIALVAGHVGRDRTLKTIDMIGLKRGDNGVSASFPNVPVWVIVARTGVRATTSL